MLQGACLVAGVLACAAAPLAAQEARPLGKTPGWGAWGGIARNSPGNLWGAESGRDAEVVAARLTWPLASSPSLALDWIIDVVPVARVSMMRDGVDPPLCRDAKPGQPCLLAPLITDPRPVVGFGAAPLGIQVRHRSGSHVQTYVDLSGGVLRFSREMPMDGAARVNYTAELGTGILIGRPGRLGAAIGYKFYHISNAGTAPRNPGLDNHMLVIGVQQILAF